MHTRKNTILIVDQEPHTFKLLHAVLNDKDFQVIECLTGKQAISLCASIKPDIILIDLEMPDIKGEDIIIAIREWTQTPIIILSANKTNEDVINGLNMGADDYVIKPFNTDVLLARINASLRKSAVQEAGEPELSNGPLRMDLVRHQVYMNNELIGFTPKEYKLLRFFMIHCGIMLSHKEILNKVWGAGHSDDTQYLRVFIGQIREKIEADPAQPVIITTELGIGYRMEFLADPSVVL